MGEPPLAWQSDLEGELTRLRAGDQQALARAVVFLEDDPWEFRSGYAKGKVMRSVARQPLDLPTRRRLDRVVLAHVDAGERWEFGSTCRLARALGPVGLRDPLVARLGSGDLGRARRALCVLVGLPRPRLTPTEERAARAIVLRLGRRPSGWSNRRLLRRLAVRLWSSPWEEELLGLAEGDSPDRSAALAILGVLPRMHGPGRRERLAAARRRARLFDG
jgi:hypothetical protein